MKKLFLLLLSITIIFTLASCELPDLLGGGDTSDATNDNGSNGDNDNVVADNTKPVHVHEYGEDIIFREATCLTSGGVYRLCECGHRVNEETPPRGHEGALLSTLEPTCTEGGYSEYACATCSTVFKDDITAPAGHDYSEGYVFRNNATATKDAEIYGYCAVCDDMMVTTLEGTAELMQAAFSGLKISILGDSISTFDGVSNGKGADTSNSTIKGNGSYYYKTHNQALNITLENTWWQQVIDTLGADRLVVNSWGGAAVVPVKTCPGSYNDRALQLHDDTGDDAGTIPDIVFIYLGTNDVNVNAANIGSYEAINFAGLDDLALLDPSQLTVAEGYAIMLDNIQRAYPGVEIYCLNVLPCTTYDNNTTKLTALSNYNDMLKKLADHMGAHYVDLYGASGITRENLETYMPPDDSDDTPNRYHPNDLGMNLIAECVMDVIRENSKYYPSEDEFLEGFEN